jgi:competence protein ComGC
VAFFVTPSEKSIFFLVISLIFLIFVPSIQTNTNTRNDLE